jgi:hypothetical protein
MISQQSNHAADSAAVLFDYVEVFNNVEGCGAQEWAMVLPLAQQEVDQALAVVAPSEDLRTQGSHRLAPSQKRRVPSPKAPSQNRRVGREAPSGVALRRRRVWGCRSRQEGLLHPESLKLAPVVGAGTIQRG